MYTSADPTNPQENTESDQRGNGVMLDRAEGTTRGEIASSLNLVPIQFVTPRPHGGKCFSCVRTWRSWFLNLGLVNYKLNKNNS